MLGVEHQRQVLRALEKALARDRAKTSIASISALGLVEMTRKRTSESLGQILCQSCPTCDGKGRVKSAETICYEIFRDILRESRAFECDKFLVLAAQVVVDRLLEEESSYVADLEEFVGRAIAFQVEPMYSPRAVRYYSRLAEIGCVGESDLRIVFYLVIARVSWPLT